MQEKHYSSFTLRECAAQAASNKERAAYFRGRRDISEPLAELHEEAANAWAAEAAAIKSGALREPSKSC
jgi:hypothetical protein